MSAIRIPRATPVELGTAGWAGVSPALVALVLALALYGNLINLVPESLHRVLYVPLNLAVGAALVAWARSRGLGWEPLGLSSGSWPTGVRWGLLLGVLLPSPLFLALVLPEPIGSLLDDPRMVGVGTAGLAYLMLVRIPLGTALFEEVLFRGVLYGSWEKTYGAHGAIVGSSAVFGVWHVTATLELLRSSERVGSPVVLGLAVAGGVVATFVGGLFFVWIRRRTGGIYGPFLAHWLVNSLAALAAFLA